MTFNALTMASPLLSNRFGDIRVTATKPPCNELRSQIQRTVSTYAPPLFNELTDRPKAKRQFYKGIIETGLGSELEQALTAELTRSLSRHGLQFRQVAPFDLTPAHFKILPLLCQGKQTQAIADTLGRSKRTVDNQLLSIYERMGVGNRTQAMVKAKDRGLIALG